MKFEGIYFSAYDPNLDFDTPNNAFCKVTLASLGKDLFGTYLVLRTSEDHSITNQNERLAAHNKIVNVILSQLKKSGFEFGNEEAASRFLHNLTAYWFDLLNANNKLVPHAMRPLTTIGCAIPADRPHKP